MAGLSRLFPEARMEVLRLLVGQPGRELHLRDLARLAGLSPVALRKELANRLYFRANTEHPLFPELHGLVLKTTGAVGEIERAMAGVDGSEAAFVFGPMAAGTGTAGSDIDVMVLGRAGLGTVVPALRGLPNALGHEINPHCLTTKEWPHRLAVGGAFIRRVEAEPKLWLNGGPDVPR